MTTSTLPQRPAAGSMKSRPTVFHRRRPGAPNATVPWTGVRNYRRAISCATSMQVGDGVLFYHSSCPRAGHCRSPAWPAAPPGPRAVRPRLPLLRPQIARRCAPLAAAGCAGPAQKRASSAWPRLRNSARRWGCSKGSRLSIPPVEPENGSKPEITAAVVIARWPAAGWVCRVGLRGHGRACRVDQVECTFSALPSSTSANAAGLATRSTKLQFGCQFTIWLCKRGPRQLGRVQAQQA